MNKNIEINVCPATLKKGFTTYSLKAIKEVFNAKRTSHILPFAFNEDTQTKLDITNLQTALPGSQTKYYLQQSKKKLHPFIATGNFILKPIPHNIAHANQLPANEHLTMQIASQVFEINTAPCALIFFDDGSPAFITRKFDRDENDKKFLVDNFATLAGLNAVSSMPTDKYNFSYEDIAKIIDENVSTAISAKEELFKRAMFNYLFYNIDVHIHHFSIIDYEGLGEYFLAPAYNLVNTRLHIEVDKDVSLTGGLYNGCTKHPSYIQLGYYAFDDFVELGKRMGLLEKRVVRFIKEMLVGNVKVRTLINNSFLSNEMKVKYYALYNNKLKRLGMSVSGKK